MSIKDLRRPGPVSSGAGRRVGGGGLARLGAGALVVLATASVALADPGGVVTGGDPIDETWRYLVELFRMLLGL
ncbi:MAG: hypothetical protein IT431_18020 [Phycisphaerales bacterium]|nr:hypothetical protein [Phycisphaerales bacterium]